MIYDYRIEVKDKYNKLVFLKHYEQWGKVKKDLLALLFEMNIGNSTIYYYKQNELQFTTKKESNL